jgi:hypothetical protein
MAVGRRGGRLDALEGALAREPVGTRVFRGAVYGTRRAPTTTASDALGRFSALPGAPRSVWQGPFRAPGGAPILKRY